MIKENIVPAIIGMILAALLIFAYVTSCAPSQQGSSAPQVIPTWHVYQIPVIPYHPSAAKPSHPSTSPDNPVEPPHNVTVPTEPHEDPVEPHVIVGDR